MSNKKNFGVVVVGVVVVGVVIVFIFKDQSY